jgi:hypothetical protein
MNISPISLSKRTHKPGMDDRTAISVFPNRACDAMGYFATYADLMDMCRELEE